MCLDLCWGINGDGDSPSLALMGLTFWWERKTYHQTELGQGGQAWMDYPKELEA